MADMWGPVEHPVEQDVKAPGEEGAVVQPDEGNAHGMPHSAENYDATDGRHNRPDHAGWASVDSCSGMVTDTDWESVTTRFPDGPGPWRQT